MTRAAPHGRQDPNSGIPAQRKWNPFRVLQKQDAIKKLGRGRHYAMTWEKKELPGAGASQYAWETYGLPMSPTYCVGNIVVTNPLRETFPGGYVFQAVGLVGIPPQGQIQGQFITQPLIDPFSAESLGVVAPGAISVGPNSIVNGAPVLGP